MRYVSHFMNYVLTFDIPKELHRVQLKAWRYLHKIKAKKHQHSVWKHNNLKQLIEIAIYIKSNGGHASILEERFLF